MKKIKTLLLVGGPIHDFKGCGSAIEDTLKDDDKFEVTKIEEDLSVLEKPNLKTYDLIVFYYTLGNISDSQRDNLSHFIREGGGFIGIHSAADSFRNNPEFRSLIGGYFYTHPTYRKYQVSIIDPEHPITKEIKEFMIEDEQYIVSYDSRVKVLCTALWEGKAFPVAWIKPWGKGRIFYLALGHDAKACKQEMFKTLLMRGAYWANRFNGKLEDDERGDFPYVPDVDMKLFLQPPPPPVKKE